MGEFTIKDLERYRREIELELRSKPTTRTLSLITFGEYIRRMNMKNIKMNINLPKEKEIKELLFEDSTNYEAIELTEKEFNKLLDDNDERDLCGESTVDIGSEEHTVKSESKRNYSEGLAADYIRYKSENGKGEVIVQQFFE